MKRKNEKIISWILTTVLLTVVTGSLVFSYAEELSYAGEPEPAEISAYAGEPESAEISAYAGEPEPAELLSIDDIPEEKVPDIKGEHDETSVLIEVREGAPLDKLNSYLSRADSIKPVTVTDEDLHLNTVKLELRDGVEPGAAIVQLETIPCIKRVQPNYIYYIPEEPEPSELQTGKAGRTSNNGGSALPSAVSASVNDPFINKCWMLQSVSACEAWELEKSEKKITVAVLDSGFNIEHEDLKNNIVASYDAAGDGIEGDKDGERRDHGSHVSGIISAEANNKKGIAGISYNAGLLPVCVSKNRSDGATDSYTLMKGYEFILDNKDKYNVKVINISIAGPVPSVKDLRNIRFVTGYEDKVLINCFRKAYDAGILTVEASGNFGRTYGSCLAAFSDFESSIIGVNALGYGDEWDYESSLSIPDYPPFLAPFSNYNMPGQTTKDISAPGQEILSCRFGDTNENLYKFDGGTSMSTPVVSGVAALIYSVNPALSATQVTDILMSSAVDLGDPGWDEKYGFGEVNAYNAVKLARDGFTLDGAAEVFKGESVKLTPSRSGNYTWSSSDDSVASVSDGVVRGLKGGIVRITATDQKGFKITRTMEVFDVSFEGPGSIRVGESALIKLNAEPYDGYIWELDNDDTSVVSAEMPYTEMGTDRYALEIKGLKPGTAVFTASYGNYKKTFRVKVLPTLDHPDGYPISDILTDKEKAALEDPNVSTVSKNKLLSAIDKAIESRVLKASTVSFDKPVKVSAKGSSKEYLVKLSMNSALRYDGRKHALGGSKSGSSCNNDLKIRVFYCEKGGNNWKEAEVKRVALKNPKKATFDPLGNKSDNVHGFRDTAYISEITLKDKELNKNLGKALNREIKGLIKKLKADKTSSYTDSDIGEGAKDPDKRIVIPVYPLFIGESEDSFSFTDGNGKTNGYSVFKGYFDNERKKLENAAVMVTYPNGKSKKLKLKYSRKKIKDFLTDPVNTYITDGSKGTALSATGNYFGYVRFTE